MGRPVKNVINKINYLRLMKTKEKPWTKANNNLLKKLYPNGDIEDLAKRFGRTKQAVWKQASRLGISKK